MAKIKLVFWAVLFIAAMGLAGNGDVAYRQMADQDNARIQADLQQLAVQQYAYANR